MIIQGLIFVAVLSLKVCLPFAGSAAHPILSYDFLREDCLREVLPYSAAGSFKDYLGALINLNSEFIVCPKSNGITSLGGDSDSQTQNIGIYSTNSINTLLSELSSSISVEIWAAFGNETTRDSTILTFASADHSGDCEFGLKLMQRRNTDSEDYSRTFRVLICSIFGDTLALDLTSGYNEINSDRINHLVFSIGFKNVVNFEVEASLIINGNSEAITVRRSLQDPGYDPTQWAPTFHLWVLRDPTQANFQLWIGTLYKLAIYNSSVENEDVLALYNEGFVNSRPVVWNISLIVQEDGEVGSHYSDPSYYENPVPIPDLVSISLPSYDLEDSYFGTNISYIFFAALPKRGELYDIYTFDKITEDRSIICCTVKFRPDFNQFSSPAMSVFDTFSIYAVDGITHIKSINTATISIIVSQVNHPPAPENVMYEVFYGVQKVISLPGYDREDGFSIQGSEITTLPQFGILMHQQMSNDTLSIINQMTYYSGVNYIYQSNISWDGKDSTYCMI